MRREENMCGGKKPYKTQQETHQAIAALSKGGGRVSSYHCTECNKWHIGHNGKGKKLIPAKELKYGIQSNHESKTHLANRRFIK
jgi:hypothetical protein